MSKFEVAITKAQKNSAIFFDSKNILVSYFYPNADNPLEIEGECDFSSMDWSNIPLSMNTKFELACLCGSQLEYISLGHADPNKKDFHTTRTFKFTAQNSAPIKFVLKVYEDKKSQFIATSYNITPLKVNSNERSIFNYAPLSGNYAFDLGFDVEEGPTLYLNKEEFPLIENWLGNESSIWFHLILPKALKDGLMHYFQEKNNTAQYEQVWVKKWETFIENLGFEIDDSLYSQGVDQELISVQESKAADIVNAYCEKAKTIEKMKRITELNNLSEND